jgi:hypothetical protein
MIILFVTLVLIALTGGLSIGYLWGQDKICYPPPSHPVHRRAAGSHPYVQDAYDRWLIDITETGPERLADTGELRELWQVPSVPERDPRLAKYIGETE